MQEAAPPDRKRLPPFLVSPLMGILGVVVGVVGISISVYLFFASRESPELTYFVHPAKAVVVRPSQTSRLSVQFNGRDLASDITATQVAFWNAGSKSIRGNLLLRPLTIRTGPNHQILEVKIRKVSRDVVKLNLDVSKIEQGIVGIEWNILEKGDGGILQLIYAGDENVDIAADAVVEGQGDIVKLEYSREIRSNTEEYENRRSIKYILPGILMLLVGAVIIVFSIFMLIHRWKNGEKLFIRREIAILIQGPLMLAMGMWAFFILRAPGPPFGF